MKKTLLHICLVLFVLFAITSTATAALVISGDFVFDSNAGANGQYWVRDMTQFADSDFYKQSIDVGLYNLTPANTQISAWRIATIDDFSNLMAYTEEEVFSQFTGAFHSGTIPSTVSYEILSGRVMPNPNTGYDHYDYGVYEQTVTHIDPDEINYYFFNSTNYRIKMWPGPHISIDASYASSTYGAWVVAGATGSPVPVPGAVWLLGSGFIGLIGLRKKLKK